VKRRYAASVLALASFLAFWSLFRSLPAAGQKVDPLVVVVNRVNATASKMSKGDAKRLLLGETITWPNGGDVVVVLEQVGSADRTGTLQKVCGLSEAEYTRHNLQATFMGGTAATVHQVASAAAMRSFIKSNPGAVGFLHASEVDENVKAVLSLD
jgi:hypothetical protein